MNKRFRAIGLILALCLLLVSVPFTTSAQQVKQVYLTAKQWNEQTEAANSGSYYMKNDTLQISSYGDHGIALEGAAQVLYAFKDSFVQDLPFLHFKSDDQSVKYIRVTRREAYWVADNAPEITLEIGTGEQAVNIADLLKNHPAKNTGWVYVAIGVSESTQIAGTPGKLEYMYLSNTDASGEVYQKPTQPSVPQLDPSKEIRYQLQSFSSNNVDEHGYGFLLSTDVNGQPNIVATPSGNGVTLQGVEGLRDGMINIAWVVPYEQLAQTPYLVVDIGNDGREDEGPRVQIFAYWEGIAGSTALFDAIPEEIGANSLAGANRLPLKYAVDTVPESLRGENGIAIIVSMRLQRTDGTTFDPLVIRDAYLLGYQEGANPAPGTTSTTVSADNVTTTTTEAVSNDASTNGGSAGLWIAVGAAIIVIAVVAIVVIRRKKS